MLGVTSKVVAAAATPERLVSDADRTRVSSLLIQVKGTNTGKVGIGPQGVDLSGDTGIVLAAPTAGQTPPSASFTDNGGRNGVVLNEFFIAVEVDGDGVTATWMQN